jgi:nicotinate dehydrogenase subunit B
VNGTQELLVDRWIAIDRDGGVRVLVGKVDLGTGIRTAFAQIVADELDVSPDRITVVEGRTGITPDQGLTVGSQSLQSGAPPLRAAAATARAVLLRRAAQRLGVTIDRLDTRDGAVVIVDRPPTGPTSLSYAELAGDGFGCEVDALPALRAPSAYRWVGHATPRVDLPAKALGTFTYVQDVAIPGMLHARIVRPPAFGARCAGVDAASIQEFAGTRIVHEGELLAVAGPDQWSAAQAARALAVQWTGGGLPDEGDTFDRLREAAGDRVVTRAGAAIEALATDVTCEAEYRWPFQSHGSLGPPCAVADVRKDSATIWCSSQGVYALRARLAAQLGFDDDAVRVVYVEGSGCFGDNGSDDAAAQAATISRAVGAPVRLQWSAAEQLGWDPKGPAMLSELRGVVREGRIGAWEHDVWTPPHLHIRGAGTRALGGAVAGDRNAAVDYDVPQRVVVHVAPRADLETSAFRSLGAAHNVFANESFVDELAHAAGADPLAFRLDHLADARARDVLERAADLVAWRAAEHAWTYGALRCGLGIAFARYNEHGAYVAAVATCTVAEDGAIGVRELAIAHDCGLVVNPDGLRNQIEGNAIQATSRALLEEVRFDRARVTSTDWTAYPILRFPAAPAVRIAVIDRPDQPALGAGEPTTIVVAPAIANAVFAATGVRLRRVPFTKARFVDALALFAEGIRR